MRVIGIKVIAAHLEYRGQADRWRGALVLRASAVSPQGWLTLFPRACGLQANAS